MSDHKAAFDRPPSRLWAEAKSADFAADDARTVVILPIGSTEQHGPHLPVQVDTLLATEVAARTARLLPNCRVLPPLWVSLAEHHMGFGGTLSLDFDTFRAVLRCLVDSLQRQGVRRVLLLNGHGGNMAALGLIVDELSRQFDLPVATATYWNVAADRFAAILEAQDTLLHACEAETSMLLALAPDSVDMQAAAAIAPPADGFADHGGVHRWRRLGEWAPDGVVGAPAAATADKGRLLLDAAAEAMAGYLQSGALWEKL